MADILVDVAKPGYGKTIMQVYKTLLEWLLITRGEWKHQWYLMDGLGEFWSKIHTYLTAKETQQLT